MQEHHTAPYTASATEVLAKLGCDAERGLSIAEANARRVAFGPNALETAPPEPIWKKLLRQFQGLVIWLLVAAAAIAVLMGEWTDAVVILAIVALNGALGFFQEEKAARTLEALRDLSPSLAKVVRANSLQSLPASELVPGDLIELEPGDKAPADARLLDCFAVEVMEAALTGESTPVEKEAAAVLPESTSLADRRNMVFSGSVLVACKARAVVTATGMKSVLGRIAGLLERYKPEITPLERRLEELGRILIFACLGLVAVVFSVHMLRGGEFADVFMFSLSLAVAAVPEGLPAVVTIALALGVQRMARRNALVRKLSGVETLGAVTVICSDKTGTLTRNEMTVQRMRVGDRLYAVTGVGYSPQGAFELIDAPPADNRGEEDLRRALGIAARCNTATIRRKGDDPQSCEIVGDPMEAALIVAAAKAGISPEGVAGRTLLEIPFDSRRRLMSIVAPVGDRVMMFTKGAPEALLPLCVFERRDGDVVPLTDERRRELMQASSDLAAEALRVLALAEREFRRDQDPEYREQELTFAGLAGMIDPPREEARQAIGRCREAGIRTVMITGDHPATARAVAEQLTLAATPEALLTGEQLNQHSDEELALRVEEIVVYARVSAEHKLRVIKALKRRNQVVAMTGDGVNDAPAVQQADVGIAMGLTGVDVTKEASDIVLMYDNFASIVNVVDECRGIYDNIRKIVHYLLSCNAGEVLFMFGAAVAGWPIPLQAIQILWINLVTDGLPAIALAMEPAERDAMRRPPRPPGEALLTADRGALILFHGSLIALAAALGIYFVYRGDETKAPAAQTACFFVLTMSQLFFALACRSRAVAFLKLGPTTNLPLLIGIVLSALLQAGAIAVATTRRLLRITDYESLPWLTLLAISLAPMLIVEIGKLLFSPASNARETAHEPRSGAGVRQQ